MFSRSRRKSVSHKPLSKGKNKNTPSAIPPHVQRDSSQSSREATDPDSPPLGAVPYQTSDSEPPSPGTPPLESLIRATTSNSHPNPNHPGQSSQPAGDPEEILQQLLASMEQQNHMEDELAQLDRQLDQQALAHAFSRATKNLEQKLPFKARSWIQHAEQITERLKDTDSQARCLYWFGRIEWFEGHETNAYFRFREAAQKLPRGCDETRRIPMYLEWLRPGVEKNKRRARLAQHGFHPPHEKKPTRVSRQKVTASSAASALPHAFSYNRYSNPGLKRKRENMEPDVAIALDPPCKSGNRREPRSKTVMTFESDRHIHPGDQKNVDPPRLHHLAYDFSWTKPQQRPRRPPSQNVFNFCKLPKRRPARFRSHKIFTKQPWEETVPKRAMRSRADGKADVTMTMLAKELNSTPYQALRYGSRARRS